jgi:hypothetical protein
MKYQLKINLFITAAILLFSNIASGEQSVYFHKISGSGGAVGSVPVNGPASAAKDLITGLSIAASGGITRDGSGNLFFTDAAANRVLLADKNGKATEMVSASAGLSSPQALAYDAQRKILYIFDQGAQRIVKADLSGSVPVKSVVDVIPSGNVNAVVVTDLKYNSADNMLYWSNGGFLLRADINNVSLPITSPEQLNTTNGLSALFFDFDSESPQNIFLADVNQGIYKATTPAAGTSNISESIIFDTSSSNNAFFTGLALDPTSNILCYGFFDGTAQHLNCGDRAAPGSASVVFDNQFFGALSSLVIDKSPSIVSPTTQPAPPVATLNLSGPKPLVLLTLEVFSGVALKSSALIRSIAQAKTTGKLGFQYSVEIKRPTDASGKPLSKKEQDIRKLTSKKNQLTVKNLKANSNYDVKYRVEITSKAPGQDVKVIKRTPYSPTIDFTIP